MPDRGAWVAVLLHALVSGGPQAGSSDDSGPIIPRGFESYFVDNLAGAQPRLQACGWRAGNISIEPRRVQYTFHHQESGAVAIVALSDPGACAQPVGKFCIAVVESPASGSGACRAAELLPGILERGVRENQRAFSWRVRSTSQQPRRVWPWAPFAFVAVALGLGGWALRRRFRSCRGRWRPGLSWPTVLAAAVLAVIGAACAVIVAAPAAFGLLLTAWLGWQIVSVATVEVDRLWVAGALLTSLFAVGIAAAVYPAGDFAMYSADSLALVKSLWTTQHGTALSRLTGPLYGFLLAAEWRTAARVATPLLAAASLTLLAVVLAEARGSRRSLWAAVLLIGVSPTFMRLAVEAPFPFVVLVAAATAARDWQRHAAHGRPVDLARSALGASVASYLLSGLLLAPLLLAAYWVAWADRRSRAPSGLSTVLWPVVLLMQVGVLVALGDYSVATSAPVAQHASAAGILWGYQLVHPVFAALAVLGMAHAVRTRPLAASSAVALGAGALTAEIFWGLSPLLAATLVFPVSWLLIAAGVAALDERLRLPRSRRVLLFVGLAAVVLHHQWLFHDVFGRLLFS